MRAKGGRRREGALEEQRLEEHEGERRNWRLRSLNGWKVFMRKRFFLFPTTLL